MLTRGSNKGFRCGMGPVQALLTIWHNTISRTSGVAVVDRKDFKAFGWVFLWDRVRVPASWRYLFIEEDVYYDFLARAIRSDLQTNLEIRSSVAEAA